tara:strand:+ start:153121 stop:153696 length:576 start_codon:yes stop_codon:yes gene_type:complete
MADIDKLMDGYDKKLKALDASKSQNSEYLGFTKNLTVTGVALGAVCFAVHFGLAALHDPEPYNQVKAEIKTGNFVVPMDYYKNDREACIRGRLSRFEDLDLDSLGQSEVLSLATQFPEHMTGCVEEDSRDNLNYQNDYLQTLAQPSWALSLGGNFIGGSCVYLGAMAYLRRRKSKTEAAIKNVKESKILLD